MISAVLSLVLVVIVLGLILWVAQQFITDPMLIKVIRVIVIVVVVVVLAAVFFIADLFGVSPGLNIRS